MEILGQSAWLVVLVGGTIILALAAAYGINRNRQRTIGERVPQKRERGRNMRPRIATIGKEALHRPAS